jgi:hypothetical protein
MKSVIITVRGSTIRIPWDTVRTCYFLRFKCLEISVYEDGSWDILVGDHGLYGFHENLTDAIQDLSSVLENLAVVEQLLVENDEPKCSHCGALGPDDPCGNCIDENGELIE